MSRREEFDAASRKRQPGFLAELLLMLRSEKKLWLLPIIAGLLLFGLIGALGGTAAAPFIYTLF